MRAKLFWLDVNPNGAGRTAFANRYMGQVYPECAGKWLSLGLSVEHGPHATIYNLHSWAEGGVSEH
jgi:hypothetical protein